MIKVPLFTIGYCIDIVVDTQVQQVATAQTLCQSKVAAPVVLFYFLSLSTRKSARSCRYILILFWLQYEILAMKSYRGIHFFLYNFGMSLKLSICEKDSFLVYKLFLVSHNRPLFGNVRMIVQLFRCLVFISMYFNRTLVCTVFVISCLILWGLIFS